MPGTEEFHTLINLDVIHTTKIATLVFSLKFIIDMVTNIALLLD